MRIINLLLILGSTPSFGQTQVQLSNFAGTYISKDQYQDQIQINVDGPDHFAVSGTLHQNSVITAVFNMSYTIGKKEVSSAHLVTNKDSNSNSDTEWRRNIRLSSIDSGTIHITRAYYKKPWYSISNNKYKKYKEDTESLSMQSDGTLKIITATLQEWGRNEVLFERVQK